MSLKHILIRDSLVNSWWIFLKANALAFSHESLLDELLQEYEVNGQVLDLAYEKVATASMLLPENQAKNQGKRL